MFHDRQDAGEQLADALAALAPVDPVVLALPRGGVPLGVIVAKRLSAPLDLVLVRKIGMPTHAEVAAGAIVDGDPPITLFNTELLDASGLTEADFAPEVARLRGEINDRRARYLRGRAPVPVAGKTAILVDDGIATGATIRVAIRALRKQAPAAIWVAAPAAPRDVIPRLKAEADRVVCPETPDRFWAVAAHYRHFDQVADAEVVRLLAEL